MRKSRGALNNTLIATAVAGLGFLATGPASAGNIFLTGHDTDYHFTFNAATPAVLAADVKFVRNGSALPVLVFDKGALELDKALTTLGIAHTTIDPGSAAVTDALFNSTVYSAFAVASQSDCGGCDLTASDAAALAAHKSAIGAFVTAGGGILGLAGADVTGAYDYVPTAASNPGGFPPSDGFVETAAGTAAGLLAENGDATHNYFSTPGTGGLSSLFQVAETNTGNVESVFISGASIGCTGDSCTITTGVPELSTWGMMLLGFSGMGFLGYRKSRRHSAIVAA
jgi:hypothetical protein